MKFIRQRLLQVESDMLSALAEGEAAILAFENNWSTLRQDIATIDLDDDTRSLAYAVSSRIEVYALTFCDLDLAANSLVSGMMDEVESIMSELTLEDDHCSSDRPDTAPCKC